MNAILTAVVVLAAIAAVTVAVCLNHIDGQTFVGVIGTALGLVAGAGIHAAGTSSGGAPAAPRALPPSATPPAA